MNTEQKKTIVKKAIGTNRNNEKHT